MACSCLFQCVHVRFEMYSCVLCLEYLMGGVNFLWFAWMMVFGGGGVFGRIILSNRFPSQFHISLFNASSVQWWSTSRVVHMPSVGSHVISLEYYDDKKGYQYPSRLI